MKCLVVATQFEADPFIDEFSLSGIREDRPYRLYRGDDVYLVVSGTGKVSAASATAYLQQVSGDEDDHVWLNAGIAGHRDLSIGSGRVAGKIQDEETGDSWFPQPPVDLPHPLCEVKTVPVPETEYPGEWVYDMEATGFYPTALRFSTAELVHVYKVISDNRNRTPDQLDRETVRDLMADHVTVIRSLLDDLEDVSDGVRRATSAPPETDEILRKANFSVTQERMLVRLLKQARAVQDGDPVNPETLGDAGSASKILETLRHRVEQFTLSFDDGSDANADD